MSLETINEPILGHNPYLGMELSRIVAETKVFKDLRSGVEELPTFVSEEIVDQSLGWLQEALYVEITWNRMKSNE